jgi:predicted nucleic acid-binding protein
MLDLNVFLDVLQNRKPFYTASSIILSKVINRELEGFLPAHALTTIFYVLRKFSGIEKVNEVLDWLLKILKLHR